MQLAAIHSATASVDDIAFMRASSRAQSTPESGTSFRAPVSLFHRMGGARGGAGCYPSSMRSFFFISRKVLAWAMACGLAVAMWAIMFGRVRGWLVVLMLIALVVVTVTAFSHVRRVR